jgi:hypothetical protein
VVTLNTEGGEGQFTVIGIEPGPVDSFGPKEWRRLRCRLCSRSRDLRVLAEATSRRALSGVCEGLCHGGRSAKIILETNLI